MKKKKKKKYKNPYKSPWKTAGLHPQWFLNGKNESPYDENQHKKKEIHDDRFKINLHYLPIILLMFMCSCASKQLVLEIVPGEQIEVKDPYRYKVINIIGLKDEQDRTFKLDIKDKYNIYNSNDDSGIRRIYEK